MTVQRFLNVVDQISTFFGKAAAWLIMVLMTVVCVEVIKRYVLNSPTAWIYDVENMLYGSLFMLCGILIVVGSITEYLLRHSALWWPTFIAGVACSLASFAIRRSAIPVRRS